MNNLKIIKIFGGILIVIGMIGLIFTINSRANTGFTTVEEMIDENIDSLVIATDNARVNLRTTNGSEVNVEFTGNNSDYELSTTVDGQSLFVDLSGKNKWKFINLNFFSGAQSLTVSIPEKMYDVIQVESKNGRIDISDIKSETIEVNTNNGRVQGTDIISNVFQATSHNGRIDLLNVTSSTVDVQAHNGRIEMEDVTGEITGISHNGRITLETDTIDRDIELETHNGRITVKSEQKPTNVLFDVKTNNGKITIFGDSNWDTLVGNGNNIVKLTSRNGSISVE